MKVLVTGANGYLGQGIVSKLIDLNLDVIATDLNSDNIDDRAKVIKCDLFSVSNPYSFFEKPDILLHLAWRDGFKHFSPNHIYDLPKHFEFINLMVQSDIKSISIMGSMHEIGFYEGSINENTPCDPVNYYGIAKNSLRSMASLLCKNNNKDFKWLRAFYIVGNSIYGSSIFSKITEAEKQGKSVFPFTSGKNLYDFLDYDIFCKQVALTVTQNKVSGIINICSGEPQRLSERVEKFIKDNNYKIQLGYGKFPNRPYDSKAIWGNNDKILEILKHYNQ